MNDAFVSARSLQYFVTSRSRIMAATISPRELAERLASGEEVQLIDVRTPAEFCELHVDFARNVPLDRLDPQAFRGESNGGSADEPLYVICRSGGRGKQACDKLAAAGLRVVNVEGGTQAWEACGLPVVRGKKVISLERQVRIAAGGLVLTGAVLALTIHPVFVLLSGFIGAGLMFAGVTDTCGMAMLLARMPWNRVGGKAACKT
jgi:rhodanese-related sulfurtransferase